jgi:hypothetical protein
MQVEINRELIEDAFRDDARLRKRVFEAIGNFTGPLHFPVLIS